MGIWPLGSMYRTLDACAGALIDAPEALGGRPRGRGHGSRRLASSVKPGYAEFAMLEQILARRGIKEEAIAGLLGGNYLRVLGQSLAAWK